MTPNLRVIFALLIFALPSLSPGKPNVVIVMTDDQGYGDLSCHGNPVLKTPQLDKLHAQSVRLTDFHVAPMCTPTRGQLLTGRDAAWNGAINVSSGRTLLRAELPTMADLFAKAGYKTGLFGKWHLGDNYPYRPQDRGFQESLWFPSSHINSTPDFWDNDYFDDTYQRNGVRRQYKGYCTDVFFDEAISWMKERAGAGEPFFAYIPTNAPHSPYWLPKVYRENMTRNFEAAQKAGRLRKNFRPEFQRNLIAFLAMIANIDDNVGKLTRFLEKAGLADDTIVVFLTDNGSTMGENYFNAGMRGRKTQLWEGGHRVPCFVRWPGGNLGDPRDVGGLTQVQDLLPTLLEFCHVKPDVPFDGMSLAKAIRGKVPILDDRMFVINYSRMPGPLDFPSPDSPSIMRREGAGVLWKHWRLLEDRQLYDLKADPKQQNNVIGSYPGVAARMRAHLDKWWNDAGPVANEAQAIIIGHEAENPMMLTACEWLDVFIDQQKQIRRGDRKNGWWELEVARAGEYEFELRRWPREADLPIPAPSPGTTITDGILPEGLAFPITGARLKLGTGPILQKPVKSGDKSVTFKARLEAGRTRLYTWFDDESRQPILGAYYVYVTRK